MEWLVNAFWIKIGLLAGEVAIAIAVVTVIAVFALLMSAPRYWRQKRCKHARYFETGKCDAICRDCGKNLGFIGNIRDRAIRA